VPGPLRNLKPDSEWQEFVPPDRIGIHNLQEPHEEEERNVTTVAETSATHQKIIAHFDGQLWTTNSVRAERIRNAWRGPDKSFWAATIDALYTRDEGGEKWLKMKKFQPANISIWRSSPAAHSGWPLRMACFAMRARSGGIR